jgi:hypothetical protein
MSETTPTRTELAPEALQVNPSDVLLNLVVSLLVPVFTAAAGGELYFARMAALATIESYRGRTQDDLLAIVQIIAFSLAAADSVSRSMAEDLPLPMVLRLRADANANGRSADRNRRALKQARAAATPKANPLPGCDTPRPTSGPVAPAAAARTRPVPPRVASPPPAADQPSAETVTHAGPSESEIQQLWATAMSTVAAEYTAGLDDLPPAERQAAQARARALNNCASELRSGKPSNRPRPGDLGAAISPNPT